MKRLRNIRGWALAALAGAVLLGALWLPGVPAGSPEGRGPGLVTPGWLLLGAAGVAALVWWRRRRMPAGDRESRLRLLERVRLEPGRSLHLVEADGYRLLVGASEGGLRLLARLGSQGEPDGRAFEAEAEGEGAP